MTELQPTEQNQSTPLTKKSILIKPDTDLDLQDLITVTKTRGGKKYHSALSRMSEKYHFSKRDYKKDRISITLDFSGFRAQQQAQENKNSEGI